MKVKKAIIATAGYGTRFLPTTKNVPKPMLPLVDVPIIHEVVRECIESGITQIIIVTSYGNSAIENYFDNNAELEDYLRRNDKLHRYERFMEVFDKADIAYVRQHKSLPYGNGTPAIVAKPFLKRGEPFAYLFADDIVFSRKPAIGQLLEKFDKYSQLDDNLGGVIGTDKLPLDEIIGKLSTIKFKTDDNTIVEQIIEKPSKKQILTPYASLGRNIVTYDIFDVLNEKATGKNNEIWFVDALNRLAQQKNLYTHVFEGTWITTGDPLNYLKAIIIAAMQRKDISKQLTKFLRQYIKTNH